MDNEDLEITLTRDEALVLFELLFRFAQEKELSIRHEAESQVLWNVLTYLENSLHEPFGAEYEELFIQARDNLIKEQKSEPE